MEKIKRILGLGVIGAIVGAFIGWAIQTFEPIGPASVTETMAAMALVGAVAVNFTVWITSNDRY